MIFQTISNSNWFMRLGLLGLTGLVIAASSAAFGRVGSESGPGNGTDYVKVLFADAQYELVRGSSPVAAADLKTLGLEKDYESWLLEPVSGHQSGTVRFDRLKYYLRKMELAYQMEPCSDGSGKPASICFFDDPKAGPYVMISLEENKMTTKEQAMAMLIHEAGHFVGEKDHLFLDQLGVRLATALRTPQALIADASSTEIVVNIFVAKDECESGSSKQAEILRKEATAGLIQQCSAQGLACAVEKASFIYRGQTHFIEGTGFDMRVTCSVRAVLRLR